MQNNTINEAAVAAWYNKHLIQAEKQTALADIKITVAGEILHVPGIYIEPGMTVDDIVRGFYLHLKDNGPVDVAPVQAPEPPEKLSDFGQVSYRNRLYLVEELGPDRHRVRRKDTGNEISAKSPTARKVVSLFLEQRKNP